MFKNLFFFFYNLVDNLIHQGRIVKFIDNKGVKIVVDIGAHKGEFLKHIKKIKSIRKIYSLEPQKKVYGDLLKEIDNKKFFAYNIAISNRNGKQKMQINDFSMTSTLSKVNENSINYLKPIAAFRYSPNNTKNISNKDVRLDYNNIFSHNRIGTNEIVEGGRSLSMGLEYEKRNIINRKIIGFNIANSISDKKNDNLPTKSKLNKTRSDFVGNLSYYPNSVLNLDYNFSYDANFNGSNYDSISTTINVNNFITNFKFTSVDGDLGNNEIISNVTTLKLNEENFLKFNTSKDLKNNFTEYYNLIYSYETDCLIASAEFNKKFYKDGSLIPDKSLLFTIRFIPFAELKPAAASLN